MLKTILFLSNHMTHKTAVTKLSQIISLFVGILLLKILLSQIISLFVGRLLLKILLRKIFVVKLSRIISLYLRKIILLTHVILCNPCVISALFKRYLCYGALDGEMFDRFIIWFAHNTPTLDLNSLIWFFFQSNPRSEHDHALKSINQNPIFLLLHSNFVSSFFLLRTQSFEITLNTHF